MIAAKFGGSSLADAAQFQKVREIVFADKRRKFVIPSAPGRRFDGDEKVTDLLYRCHAEWEAGKSFLNTFEEIRERYDEIAQGLHLTIDLAPYFEEIRIQIERGASADYCASRGEYLNGLLLANFLEYEFLDAAEVIFFDEKNEFDCEKTNIILSSRLEQVEKAVIPGFYGSKPDGSICVFSRGGSDITGAIVARGAKAALYENWTDVSGFLMADPRIVSNPNPISHITYQEMHELCCAGATVLHEDCVLPVSLAGIPTNIRNTNFPAHKGTVITGTALQRENFAIFAGLSGKKGFSLLILENQEERSLEFIQKALQAAENCGLKFQYLPSAIQTVCLLVDQQRYQSLTQAFADEMEKLGLSYTLTMQTGVAGIVLVGYGIVHNKSAVNRIYQVLQQQGISVIMINQGCSELSTWVGVQEQDMEEAIRIIYKEFV